MNFANLKLCKELYELSGWCASESLMWNRVTRKTHRGGEWEDLGGAEENLPLSHEQLPNYNHENKHDAVYSQFICPAYDLDYLRVKILEFMGPEPNQYPKAEQLMWESWVHTRNELAMALVKGCDATCKLAIELFKQNILTREGLK